MARKLKSFLESLSITINNTWDRQLSIILVLSETGWLKRVKFGKVNCLLPSGPRAFLSFKSFCKFDPPLIAHLSSYDSHSRNRDSIGRSSRRKRSYFECSNIMLCILHKVWFYSFITSKNIRTAGLVQNQVSSYLSLTMFSVLNLQGSQKWAQIYDNCPLQSPLPTVAISSWWNFLFLMPFAYFVTLNRSLFQLLAQYNLEPM